MKLIYILSLMIFTINFAASQNLSPKEKIKREIQILDNFENKDWNEKSTIFREITELWFDKAKYKVEIEESAKNNKANYAAIISDRTNEDNQKLAFFDSKTGKIVKMIHLDQINPYTKAKDKKIDNTNLMPRGQYNFTENPHELNPVKYISFCFRHNWLNDNPDLIRINDLFILNYRKFGLNINEIVIDEWDTFILFDTRGNIIMEHEFKVHSLYYELNMDANYFLIRFGVEGWERDGFCVYDIKAKKEVYYYLHPKNNKYFNLNGVGFDSKNGNFLSAYLTNHKKDNINYEEKLIIDLSKSLEYRYTFSREESIEISINWSKKYKSLENLLNYFDFKNRKF